MRSSSAPASAPPVTRWRLRTTCARRAGHATVITRESPPATTLPITGGVTRARSAPARYARYAARPRTSAFIGGACIDRGAGTTGQRRRGGCTRRLAPHLHEPVHGRDCGEGEHD